MEDIENKKIENENSIKGFYLSHLDKEQEINDEYSYSHCIIKKESFYLPIAKEMLITNQKMKILEEIKSFKNTKEDVKRIDIIIPNSRCFLLENLLSKEECETLIEKSEDLGYSTLSDLFPKDYRQNDRLLTKSEWLADVLYQRVQKHFKKDDILRLIPVGFGNQGTWKPTRFNECIKFSKTMETQYFKPHIDGPWIPRDEESSVYTMIIYLNEDFEGGKTIFLKEGFLSSEKGLLHSVEPKQGMALFFTHDTLHEGEPVFKGTKYILRTELLFERVDRENQVDVYQYLKDENYLKAVSLYQKSVSYEYKDPKIFKDSYFESLKLMVENQKTVNEKYIGELKTQILPYDIMVHLFQYLEAKELYEILTVNKAWFDTIRDGEIWKFHYERKWTVEKIKDIQTFSRDWFGEYYQMLYLKDSTPIVVDLGSFYFKYGSYKDTSDINLGKVENYVATHQNAFHMRRGKFEDTYVGEEAKKKHNPYDMYRGCVTKRAVQSGVVNLDIIPELFCYLFYKLKVRSRFSHVLLIEPFPFWSTSAKCDIAVKLMSLFKMNMLAFVHPAVCVLQNYNSISGLVVSLGDQIGCITPVFQGEVLEKYMVRIEVDIQTKELSKILQDLTDQFPKNVQYAFKSFTILSGGGSTKHTIELQSLLKDYKITCPDDVIYDTIKGALIYEKKVKKSEDLWFRDKDIRGDNTGGFYYTLLSGSYHWKAQILGIK